MNKMSVLRGYNYQTRKISSLKVVAYVVFASLLLISSGDAYGDKVCISVTVNKKLKTSIRTQVAATCPKGFNELVDTATLAGPAGPAGPAGATGSQGPAGAQGPVGSRGLSAFDPLPSGTTVRGVVGGWGNTANLSFVTESLPASTTTAIKSQDMIIAHTPRLVSYCESTYVDGVEDCLSADELAKDETVCTGSFDNPTAPAGKVCIYVDVMYMAYDLEAQLVAATANPAQGSPFGFGLQWFTASGTSKVKATWAYTAP